MRPEYRPKPRKRGKRQFWSKSRPKSFRRHVFFLPTRNTLTVAEAQRFVDVELDGSVHRLDVGESLDVVSNVPGDIECSSLQTGRPPTAEKPKDEMVADSNDCTGIQNCLKPCVRILKQQQKLSTEEFQMPSAYCRRVEEVDEKLNKEVEYDMDEQDVIWLGLFNESRRTEKLNQLSPNSFEYIIDRLEKESFASSFVSKQSSSAVSGRRVSVAEPCAVCLELESQPSNAIVSCDSCSMTVHQDCYGIPYIPDGSWVCRVCLRCSPGATYSTECCLCPVTGGALKQTDDGQFAHIICARWIPEVRFGNAVYLEPIEHIQKVPSWRRRLTCSICRSCGAGACIRCEMPRCDTAFHVTCAQQAGVYLHLEMSRGVGNCSRAAPPRRTVFCDLHRPVKTSSISALSLSAMENGNMADPLKTPKKVKKLSCDEISEFSGVVSSGIAPQRLLAISESLCMRDKQLVMSRLHSYWLLKRQVERGMPLIHRLKYCADKPNVPLEQGDSNGNDSVSQSDVDFLKCLRNSMDQARKLLELVCEREKMKKNWMAIHERTINLQLQPLPVLLHHILDQLRARDPGGVFALPVPVDEVPDYLEKITHPMDFSSMQDKIDSHCYATIDQFENDFQLMINNCMTYNEKGSVFYRIAVKLQRECSGIISAARRMSERAGYCQQTGLHLPSAPLSISLDLPSIDQTYDFKSSSQSHATNGLSLDDQLKVLLRRLDVLQVVRTYRNAHECRMLRRRISVVKRHLTYQKQQMLGGKSPYRSPGRPRGKAQSPDGRMCLSASSRRSLPGHVNSEKSPQLRHKIRRRRLSLSPPNARGRPVGRLISPGLTRPAISSYISAQSRSKRIRSDDSAVTSCSSTEETSVKGTTNVPVMKCSVVINALLSERHLRSSLGLCNNSLPDLSEHDHCCGARLVNGVLPPAVDTLQHNGSARLMSLPQKMNEQPMLYNGHKRKLSDCESHVTELQNHYVTRRKRSSTRIHMMSRSEMGTSSLAISEVAENDSSYESSYSIMSDSDISNDVGGSFGPVNGSQQVLTSSIAVKLKATRSSCSIDAVDITTPLHKGDVVWAKAENNPWYPAVVVCMPDSVLSSRRNGLTNSGLTPLPVPSSDVLTMQYIYAEPVYLVQIFDKQLSWNWLPRHKLEPLGQNVSQDDAKIAQVKHWKSRAMMQAAFEKAVQCHYR